MSGSITVSPFGTSAPTNQFLQQTQGYVVGATFDDPASRLWLMGGQIYASESLTMWGGVPVEELINLNGVTAAEGLGPTIKHATSQATATGWSVTNQAGSMIIGPGNNVPIAGAGGYVSFYRYGSNMRLAVNCDPAIVTALVSSDGSISSQSLYWDVTNYRITLVTSGGNWALPTTTKLLAVNANSKTVAYAAGPPVAVTWTTGDAAMIQI